MLAWSAFEEGSLWEKFFILFDGKIDPWKAQPYTQNTYIPN